MLKLKFVFNTCCRNQRSRLQKNPLIRSRFTRRNKPQFELRQSHSASEVGLFRVTYEVSYSSRTFPRWRPLKPYYFWKSNRALSRDDKRQNDVLNTRLWEHFARITTAKHLTSPKLPTSRGVLRRDNKCQNYVLNTRLWPDFARIITKFPQNTRPKSNYYIAIQAEHFQDAVL